LANNFALAEVPAGYDCFLVKSATKVTVLAPALVIFHFKPCLQLNKEWTTGTQHTVDLRVGLSY